MFSCYKWATRVPESWSEYLENPEHPAAGLEVLFFYFSFFQFHISPDVTVSDHVPDSQMEKLIMHLALYISRWKAPNMDARKLFFTISLKCRHREMKNFIHWEVCNSFHLVAYFSLGLPIKEMPVTTEGNVEGVRNYRFLSNLEDNRMVIFA